MCTFYVIPGSHDCRSAMLMLEHKQVPHQRVQVRRCADGRLGYLLYRRPLALILYRTDAEPLFEGRPALELVDGLLPEPVQARATTSSGSRR